MSEVSSFDQMRFREVLGHYPTGVVIITAIAEDGDPVGMVVGSFASVSLDPPLVTFIPSKSSSSYARLKQAQSFCVNVLSGDQQDLCRQFASKRPDKFEGVGWRAAPSGAPILDGVVAWIDCTVWSVADGGDSDVVIGRVEALDVVNPSSPLLFFQGGYGRFGHQSLIAADTELIDAIGAAERGRDSLQWLADELDIECNVIAAVGEELVYVSTAVGPSRSARAVLGTRFPLMAPLGELHAVLRGPEAEQRWLDRASDVDEETRAGYVRRLDMARQRGWSMSLKGQRPEGELHEALRTYSSVTLTPAQERQVRERVTMMSRYYLPVDLEPGQSYDLHSLVLPIKWEPGGPELALRLAQLPLDAPLETVEHWLELGRRAAARMAGAVAARPAGV